MNDSVSISSLGFINYTKFFILPICFAGSIGFVAIPILASQYVVLIFSVPVAILIPKLIWRIKQWTIGEKGLLVGDNEKYPWSDVDYLFSVPLIWMCIVRVGCGSEQKFQVTVIDPRNFLRYSKLVKERCGKKTSSQK